MKPNEKVPDLLIVGQATIDDIYREGEGPVSLGTPGGDSIYSVLGASVWPVRTGVVTVVGDDYPNEKLDRATCSPGFTDWSGIKRYRGPSIHDKAMYYKDGRRNYEFENPGLLETLSPGPEDIPAYMDQCGYVHIAPADTQHQYELLAHFRSRGAVVSLDVETHFFEQDASALKKALALSPIFMPSIEHVQRLSGIHSTDVRELWPWIAGCGASMLVVKCGSQGSWVIDVPTATVWQVGIIQDLHIVDVTGAGDSFCGGYMAGLAITGDRVRAAAYGTVSASFIVESLGALKPEHYEREVAEARLTSVMGTIVWIAL